MTAKSDKQRIIALQKALKVAKEAMQSALHSGRVERLEDAIYEIEMIDVNSKPTGLQGICGHGRNVR